MASSTVQQYLKTIFLIERRTGEANVGMKVLADAMGVTAGTATSMAKHLSEKGLIDYRPRKGTNLTTEGRAVAVSVVRRHRLLEAFLEKTLDYDWSEVHDEAEELEHVVSDRFVERIDRLLGFPETDPHGDPIPRPDGAFATRDVMPLTHATPGSPYEIARLTDDSSAFLNMMSERGLRPGSSITLESIQPAAGTFIVRSTHDKRDLALSAEAARTILVRR